VLGHLLRIGREIGWIAALIFCVLLVAVGVLAVLFILLYKPWEWFSARWRRRCLLCERSFWKSNPHARRVYSAWFCSEDCERTYFLDADQYTDADGPYPVGAPRPRRVIQ
jgi:hypothetical protein